jgi:hypothetical protein
MRDGDSSTFVRIWASNLFGNFEGEAILYLAEVAPIIDRVKVRHALPGFQSVSWRVSVVTLVGATQILEGVGSFSEPRVEEAIDLSLANVTGIRIEADTFGSSLTDASYCTSSDLLGHLARSSWREFLLPCAA